MGKRKALVTGGAGFIGSHLCNKLIENNYDVIAYDDLSNGSGRKNLSKNIKFVKGNILDRKKIKTVFNKVDVVFNLAVKPLVMSFYDPEEVVKVNDYGTYLVAKMCVDSKKKLIHVSSSEAYGSAVSLPMKEKHPLLPSTIYASSKAASELYVRGFEKTDGLKMVIIRPFNCYGEFMRNDVYGAVFPKFLERLNMNKVCTITGNGKQTRDFTYVDDTCEGIMLADQSKKAIGETFNVGQGKETSINKIAQLMTKKYNEITGKEISCKFKYTRSRPGDVMRHLSDISKARKILGYKPKVSIDEGLNRVIEWNIQKQK
ncbi:SDR family NAD(P)-dependent oxidoreductase [Nitrosopumilus sp. K4]|uniref:SDR family NAD(P)-dependent oxidoreductase n=1 Tax=Nitrosopumilus sp. K4 TaxID=2795383 RepID=UPI001BAB562E|nr:SDR family NAD(P)-dependent oxidoreductase [Nitrosopumilus sp. K4]QUC64451.1 SDR family NAD(P)-dependent oxidoreductase [Nitrosopumilus sp. K4]